MASACHAFSCRIIPPSPSPGKDGFSGATSPADGFLAISDGGEDRFSRLPDEVLSNIVERLNFRDGVCVSMLSPRWRSVWSSTPIDLVDTYFIPDLNTDPGFDWLSIANKVTYILTAHRGSFRDVYLSYTCYIAATRSCSILHQWLGILADKGVRTLELLNFPPRTSDFPIECLQSAPMATSALPANVRIPSLRRLKLFNWNFPSTDDICRGQKVFPFLHELVLGMTNIRSLDIDRVIQYSPVLEKIIFTQCVNPWPRLLIRSRSLRCMIFWESTVHELQMTGVPKLQRLIFMIKCPDGFIGDGFRTKIGFGRAPSLQVLGYLDPSIHVLEIGNTIIKAETKPHPATMLPSVKVLALNVRLGVPSEANMMIGYLKCFPRVQTLHVMSQIGEPGKFDVDFWKASGPFNCLQSTLRKVVFMNFQGKDAEFAFLKFVWESAKVLKRMLISLADGNDAPPLALVIGKVQAQFSTKQFRGRMAKLILCAGWEMCTFKMASDLSVTDPFLMEPI